MKHQNTQPPPVLRATDISLRYANAKPLVEGFSLTVAAGEIVTVLGSSGIGKSSLLRILAGLESPASGSVLIGEKALRQASPDIAMMFQDPCLLPWLTLEQNVSFGLNFKCQPTLDRGALEGRVAQAIDEVGLSTARSKYPHELSGGMAQRTALARCVARQPRVLLLDEPFGALDEVTREAMQALLLRLCDNHQTAAVLITHDIDEALTVSDRILLLGGAPAHVYEEWTLADLSSRDALHPEVLALRVDIVKALRRSMEERITNRPSSQPENTPYLLQRELADVL